MALILRDTEFSKNPCPNDKEGKKKASRRGKLFFVRGCVYD